MRKDFLSEINSWLGPTKKEMGIWGMKKSFSILYPRSGTLNTNPIETKKRKNSNYINNLDS
jgi:hypothetical protein